MRIVVVQLGELIFELIDFGKGARAKTFCSVQILLHARIYVLRAHIGGGTLELL